MVKPTKQWAWGANGYGSGSPSRQTALFHLKGPTHNCCFIVYFPLGQSCGVYTTFLSKCISKSIRFLCSHCCGLTLLLSSQILVFVMEIAISPVIRRDGRSEHLWYFCYWQNMSWARPFRSLCALCGSCWMAGKPAQLLHLTLAVVFLIQALPRAVGMATSHCSSPVEVPPPWERSTLTKIKSRPHIRPNNHFLLSL